MSKVNSAELHGNENASIQFAVATIDAVTRVRETISDLATSRNADEYAPGAIHALRKLCEGEGESDQIHRIEVEEWQATFDAWFERVKKHFPPKLVKKFQANAADDFRVLLKCADDSPEFMWRDELSERRFQITFKNTKAFDAAVEAAEKKHPVELGNALEKYLLSCIAKLAGKKSPPKSEVKPQPTTTDSLTIRFTSGKKHSSLSVDDFGCFDTPADLEQDIVVTAYDLEDAVKQHLKANSPKILKSLRFECESSLFEVRSTDPSALVAVVEALYARAAGK